MNDIPNNRRQSATERKENGGKLSCASVRYTCVCVCVCVYSGVLLPLCAIMSVFVCACVHSCACVRMSFCYSTGGDVLFQKRCFWEVVKMCENM